MSKFTLAACQRRRRRGGKGALYRETLQATGFYVGRIVIATAEFAPMPPLHLPGYPGGLIPTAIGMRFRRHDGIYRSDVVQTPNPRHGIQPPPAGRPRAQAKERVGRTTLLSSSAMSSGRLFLDRVGRHQSPSPLHRHGQNNMHPATLPARGDISTLPATGHFYFALTQAGGRLLLTPVNCIYSLLNRV